MGVCEIVYVAFMFKIGGFVCVTANLMACVYLWLSYDRLFQIVEFFFFIR